MGREFSEESVLMNKSVGDPSHSELFRYLDSVGDGSGTKDASTAADEYLLTPAAGEVYLIDEIRIVGWDSSNATGATFIGDTALTNGCKLEIREDPSGSNPLVVCDLTDGIPIKNNGHLLAMGLTSVVNQGTDSFVYTRIFTNGPYRLNSGRGESLVFESQDSLANLDGFYVMAIGRKYQNTTI